MSAEAFSGGSRPVRLGYVGLGWIGRHRMEAMVETGLAEVAAISDPSPDALEPVVSGHPDAAVCRDFDQLLRQDLDGVVIATPSALHARQAIAALQAGKAVFCQKPVGRSAPETAQVVDAARKAGRLLSADMSYRYTAGMRAIGDLLDQGRLGDIHYVDLTFHNAYGPDKAWFYDPELAGGGCVMDLGVHLVDLAQQVMGGAQVIEVEADLYHQGRRLERPSLESEDLALATLRFDTGAVARLACSWRAPAGQEAVIGVELFGSNGGAAFRNVEGSFYDFVAEHHEGTRRARLAEPPDAWGGRAAADWVRRLAQGEGFEPEVSRLVETAAVLDRIYGREVSRLNSPTARSPKPMPAEAMSPEVL